MTRRPDERHDDVAKLWSAPVVPVDDPARVEARRQPTVDAIGRAIRAAALDGRRRRRQRWVLGTFSAAAAVLLAMGIARWSATEGAADAEVVAQASPEPVVEVHSSQGSLGIDRGGRVSVVPLGSRAPLRDGDAVVTETQSSGTLALSSRTEVAVASATRVELAEVGGDVPRIRVERGHVGARVDEPHDGSPKLVVETPDATIVVVGTVFTVDVSERAAASEGFTTVAVLRGTVVIEQGGAERARIGAGQTWSSRAASAGSALAPPAAAERPTEGPAALPGHRRSTLVPAAEPAELSGTLAIENRLFQQAIAARNAGDDATVVRRLGELIRAFPQSPLMGEARAERDRALERLGAETPSL